MGYYSIVVWRDSECPSVIAYLSQLHKQLVKFNWYRKSGGDDDKALTWGRDLINPFFPEYVYSRSLFFFLARSPMFSKRTKRKIKQRLGTGYWSHILTYSFLISKEARNLKQDIRLSLT